MNTDSSIHIPAGSPIFHDLRPADGEIDLQLGSPLNRGSIEVVQSAGR
ncbi:hypothetical protein [Amycolatopsis sp. H20-H5]|nr:hypothetical protein [Amycolatopsis sp. H20-H5]MEC3980864.1 hypothetical protein [Amycolatopsis sp. H20-H5]